MKLSSTWCYYTNGDGERVKESWHVDDGRWVKVVALEDGTERERYELEDEPMVQFATYDRELHDAILSAEDEPRPSAREHLEHAQHEVQVRQAVDHMMREPADRAAVEGDDAV